MTLEGGTHMAGLIPDDEIAAALQALPGWSYEDGRLTKRADVPADSQDALLEAVGRVADDMDHHPDVERAEDGVTFRLWTHSAGGVTAKDVDLAARIDQQLSGAGSDTAS
jgi:4a-hydroxytetrahydrobiopterin dehydratase